MYGCICGLVYKCMDVQGMGVHVYRCTSLWVNRDVHCTVIQVFRCTIVYVYKSMGVQMYKCMGVQRCTTV